MNSLMSVIKIQKKFGLHKKMSKEFLSSHSARWLVP